VLPEQLLDGIPIHALLVAVDEDCRASLADLAARFRHSSCQVDWVADYEEGMALVKADQHDICLIHQNLGGHTGLELISQAAAAGVVAPLVLLAAADDPNLELEALESGAADWLIVGGIDAVQLERSLRHALLHGQHLTALRTAKQQADAATLAKSKFLATISHDIRTPLNVIVGNTELLLAGALAATQRESLEAIDVAADSLLTLVDDLLDVSRIEANQLELDRAPFSIRDVAADVVKVFARRAEQKGIDLRCVVPSGVPETLVGDASRLRQVLMSLVGNALKFTGHGHIEIRFRAETGTGQECVIHFDVEDTGIGIEPDAREEVFSGAGDTAGTGRGIGLAMVRQIVTQMGGEVGVASKPGHGSTFSCSIRLQLPEVGAAPRTSAATGSAAATTVLVVASTPEDRRTIGSALEVGGFTPIVVADAAAGVDAITAAQAREVPVRAIVLDTAYKPFEIATLLTEEAGAGVPVTLVVPSGRRGDEPRCRESGVRGYLGKPAAPGELAAIVTATMDSAAGDLVTRSSLRRNDTLRVLVVDDAATNLRLTEHMLTERGHDVTAVATGMEAIDQTRDATFDVILMDLEMPGLDGFETVAAIRSEETLKGGHVRIVALTAHATSAEEARCRAAGMDGFLAKPVRPDALFAAVENDPGTDGRA
jgi:two-component system sensor histidine kinase/response regulator